ncbi:3-oxoacyl-ACP reductase [Streptomyces sp. CB09001]|uniref:SDR family oxidoreductase n=1 Tax=unclassified Streptomyces TaxID=2593676 RepID=UPI000E21AAC8|nr:SDR family oxidoreductase [Streptomyces sp. CB09001]AXL91910.1 3-oxoacyl-ACP reductase [Streptomyces sp. CB09001]
MRNRLRDRWCLVLGASSGMGRATALALADQGAHIAGVHLDRADGLRAARELECTLRAKGVRAHLFNVNAASDRGRATLLPALAELTGGRALATVLHSLAFGSLVPFLPTDDTKQSLTRAQLEMTLDVMAHSLVYWTQDLLSAGLLAENSRVFAMTSAGTSQVLPSYGAVSAAKAALESHVRQLACELAPHGVAVNALRAGVTVTPSLLRIPGHEEFTGESAAGNPHGRLTTPEDVAETVVLLSNAPSSWLTGNTIGVDGAELVAAGATWSRREATR